MPELPEVETIKRGLAKAIVGKKISGAKVLREKSFKGSAEQIVGKKIVGISRRAKLLIIELGSKSNRAKAPQKRKISKSAKNNGTIEQSNNRTMYLVIHLKMTGVLVYRRESKKQKAKSKKQEYNSKLSKSKDRGSPYDIQELPNKYTRVVIEFGDGSKLFFNDLRVFGWMKIISKIKNKKLKTHIKNEKQQKLKTDGLDQIIGEKLGPEALGEDFTVEYLKEVLSNWGRPVKLLLMDQKKIAGIGNIYANEVLFCAGIAPHHRGRELVRDHLEKVKKLHKCIRKVLKKGIKYGGSTASDDAFRNIKGERGGMQQHLKVYAKAGEDCPNKCGKKIRRMTLGGRGTFFCPRCQR